MIEYIITKPHLTLILILVFACGQHLQRANSSGLQPLLGARMESPIWAPN